MYAWLMRTCGAVSATTFGAITILVCFDVLSRNLGMRSLSWINEITEYALPLATLAAAPWLMWRNQHVRLDLLGAVLSATGQRRLDRLASLLGLVVSLILTWYGVMTVLDSRAAGSVILKSLVFPEWWLYTPFPIGFALLALECGRRVIRPEGLVSEQGAAV
jgi:TRAP-type C4-dicarboxylate transport system permease small subunit